ncbi:hypothetical protein YDYSG_36630 [Paenibacillus tyrfis]|uniref:hypothetical protein n=1 Tax=Paenibacillus tyrfis TaxID=1501230 RepID=UPI002490DD81|nr:hypothetical protein [Paenibacillus tyrfis]GLI07633.1 hypothetical protein YDYSG_36630 [Paenibacillus tyrfis]
MKKKIVSAVVATALVCSLSASAFAQDNVNPSAVGRDIRPMAVDKEWNDNFKDQSTVTRFFTINPDYGHVKLHFQNNSDKPVKISLEHRASGFVYISETLWGNSSWSWNSWDKNADGVKSGDYVVTFSGGENNVNGHYWGKAASKTSDF